jgi:hypothetical protein
MYLCYQNNNLERIFEKTNDVEFLKKCCNDISTILCWESIKILIKNGLEKELVSDIGRRYLILNHNN